MHVMSRHTYIYVLEYYKLFNIAKYSSVNLHNWQEHHVNLWLLQKPSTGIQREARKWTLGILGQRCFHFGSLLHSRCLGRGLDEVAHLFSISPPLSHGSDPSCTLTRTMLKHTNFPALEYCLLFSGKKTIEMKKSLSQRPEPWSRVTVDVQGSLVLKRQILTHLGAWVFFFLLNWLLLHL